MREKLAQFFRGTYTSLSFCLFYSALRIGQERQQEIIALNLLTRFPRERKFVQNEAFDLLAHA